MSEDHVYLLQIEAGQPYLIKLRCLHVIELLEVIQRLLESHLVVVDYLVTVESFETAVGIHDVGEIDLGDGMQVQCKFCEHVHVGIADELLLHEFNSV